MSISDHLKMHSPNLVDSNIEKIAALFPNCITETKDENGELKKAVDFDLLKQELSQVLVEGEQERYRLDWVGKKEAILTANAPIAKTLRPCREESVNFDKTENLFIEGDNLEALKLLQENYLGKVKMIYIDPPYNTGNDFIYEDDFAESTDTFLEKSNQVDGDANRLVSNAESNGRFHSDWLSMMYGRLKLARNLLSDEGVIFISISEEELDNLSKLIKEVFGEANFRNTFIARRHDKNLNNQFVKSGLKSFNIGFEYIITIAKSDNYKFNPVYKAASESRANNGYWKGFWNDADRPTMRYDLLGVEPTTGQWKWSKDVAETAVKNYEEYLQKYSEDMTLEEYWVSTGKVKKFIKRNMNGNGKNKGVEHWIPQSEGILRNTNLLDIMATATPSVMGNYFSFPKNIELMKTFLKMSSNENDIILDFFAGSSTTAHAVMEQNIEDGGNRKFIMVQLPEPINEKHEAYKLGFKTIAELSKERIRRAGKKILEDNANKEGIENLDIGFRVLKIDSSNMKDVYYTPDALKQVDMLDLADHIKADRTSEDLLFQVMLDWGIELSLPIERKTIAGKEVFYVAGNSLVACFDELTFDVVDEVAKDHPLRFVSAEKAIHLDHDKTNIKERFKQLSPDTEVKFL